MWRHVSNDKDKSDFHGSLKYQFNFIKNIKVISEKDYLNIQTNLL